MSAYNYKIPNSLAYRTISLRCYSRSYLGDRAGEVEAVGEAGPPNLETVAEFEPDLIIGSSFLIEDVYEQLSEIAPTVALDTFDSVGWKDTTLPLLGEALGRGEEVEQALARYRERVREIATAVGEPGEIEVSSVSVYDDSFSINGSNYPGCVVLADIGFARPEPQRFELSDDGMTSQSISEERIPLMDGDAIFVGSVSESVLADLRERPLWQNLGAVQNDRAYEVNQEAWIFPGLFAADSVLDDIQEHLAG